MTAATELPAAVHAARGVVLAVAAATLGMAAQVLGDGTVPNAGMALLIGGLAGSAGLAVADRCRGVVAAIGALTAAQLILHAVLLVPSRVTHSHVAPVLIGLNPMVEFSSHVLAIVLLGVLLTQADTAVRALCGLVWRTMRWVTASLTPPRVLPWTPPTRAVAPSIATEVLLRRSQPRRGPPATR
ncbi:hypothetical protein NQK81_34975 [Amycolatopsis roodepoortensis]|uniref:hypothetical protein n=1 Tax=Amycolatopsis roodepoortensis TaxID=700274 RepID=UPI00214CAF24|nr:hypothetical protein [Amycolatopsis roodepoortensis]UUV29928.1 hypothetical protein NQK81_34975 [Amycolatopsis roodepoortensis]